MPKRHEVSARGAEILKEYNVAYDRVDVDWNPQSGGGMRIAVAVDANEELKETIKEDIKKAKMYWKELKERNKWTENK